MAQRITQIMLDQKQLEFGRILAEKTGIKEVTLHHGNYTAGVTNKLIIGKTNVWADGMGGHSKRDAYNALRVMIAALALTGED